MDDHSSRLPQDRRIALYRDYMQMRLRAFAVGQYLLKLISAYADGGPERAEAVARQSGAGTRRPVSSRGAARSGPEGPGSA